MWRLPRFWGASRIRILMKEVIPNSISSVLIMATTGHRKPDSDVLHLKLSGTGPCAANAGVGV